MVSIEREIRRKTRRARSAEEVLENNTMAAEVAKHLLKLRPVKKQGNKTVVPLSKEELNARFLSSFINNEKIPIEEYIMDEITQEKLIKYAKKNNLPERELKLNEKEKKAHRLIKELSESLGDEQTTHATHKSYLLIRKILEKHK